MALNTKRPNPGPCNCCRIRVFAFLSTIELFHFVKSKKWTAFAERACRFSDKPAVAMFSEPILEGTALTKNNRNCGEWVGKVRALPVLATNTRTHTHTYIQKFRLHKCIPTAICLSISSICCIIYWRQWSDWVCTPNANRGWCAYVVLVDLNERCAFVLEQKLRMRNVEFVISLKPLFAPMDLSRITLICCLWTLFFDLTLEFRSFSACRSGSDCTRYIYFSYTYEVRTAKRQKFNKSKTKKILWRDLDKNEHLKIVIYMDRMREGYVSGPYLSQYVFRDFL